MRGGDTGQIMLWLGGSPQRVLRAIAALYAAQSLVRLHGLCTLSAHRNARLNLGAPKSNNQAARRQMPHPFSLSAHVQLVPVALTANVEVYMLDAALWGQRRMRVSDAYNAQPAHPHGQSYAATPSIETCSSIAHPFLCCHTYWSSVLSPASSV